MIRLNRLLPPSSNEEDADDEGSVKFPFLPSVLDASVRYAHGGSDTGIRREVARIEEEARRLEEHHREE